MLEEGCEDGLPQAPLARACTGPNGLAVAPMVTSAGLALHTGPPRLS